MSPCAAPPLPLGQLALRAALHEAAVTPKPGLVCPDSQGAHTDMDFPLLVASAFSLAPYFDAAARLGRDSAHHPPEAVFEALRQAGREAEAKMLAVTGGVNTHRGLVFSLGILVCATARNHALGLPCHCAAVCAAGAALVRGVTAQDLAPLEPLRVLCASARGQKSAQAVPQGGEGLPLSRAQSCPTVPPGGCPDMPPDGWAKVLAEARRSLGRPLTAGERLYVRHGVTGARGEAEQGFPHLAAAKQEFDRWKTALGFNGAAVHALLRLMADSVDTNILHRGGLEALALVRAEARRTLALGGLGTPGGRAALEALGALCLERRLSPGGCADMLALTLYFHFLENAL